MTSTNARLADEAFVSRTVADLALEAAASDKWQWNVASGKVDLAPSFYASLGYAPDELPSQIDELVNLLGHPDDVAPMRLAVANVATGRTDRIEIETRLRSKCGTWRWMLSRGRTVKLDLHGRPAIILGINVDITERKKSEMALRSSEERFRAIFNSVDDFIFIHDARTGAILDCNDRACVLYGYSREEMRGRDVQALSSGTAPYTKVGAAVWMAAARAGRPQQVEWHARSRAGRLFWVEIRVRAATIGGRELLLVAGRNVTERREAAKALEWDAKISATMADLGKQLLLDKTPNEIAEWIAAAAKELTSSAVALAIPTGADAEGLVSETVCGGLPPQDCPLIKDVLKAGRPAIRNDPTCANTLVGGCGRFVAAPAVAGGHLMGMVVVAGSLTDYRLEHMDIVERFADQYALFLQRLHSEATLRDSEERFRSMTKAAQDAVIVLDGGGRVTFWNPAAERLFQYTADEIVGQELHPLIMPDSDNRDYRSNYRHFAATGEGGILNRTLELVARRKDGHQFPVELSVAPFRFGSTWNAIGIVRDISDRKELQQQLIQLQKMEALGNLAGGIAHDFNNLILPIIMFTEMAIDDLPAGSPTAQMLNTVLGAGERAKELVARILAFSRRVDSERVTGNLLAVVEEALELVRATMPTSVELRRELADVGELPFDRSQIETVLLNLASNSVDAIDGKTGWVSVGLSRVVATEALAAGVLNIVVGKDYALLRGKDSGCGMPAEVVDRLFDPFFTTKPVGQGTGLGMPMVHSIVRNHGGAIRVHSLVGKGTTVEIYLPLEP
ncbi:MAG: PAS domain S-box protein [Pseudomonadota bacterium]